MIPELGRQEAGKSLWVKGNPDLHSESQQGTGWYPILKTEKKKPQETTKWLKHKQTQIQKPTQINILSFLKHSQTEFSDILFLFCLRICD